MSAGADQRVPPRFVPTLTEVVPVPQTLGVRGGAPEVPIAGVTPELPSHADDAPSAPSVVPAERTAAQAVVSHRPVAMDDAWVERVASRVLAELDDRLKTLLPALAAEIATELTQRTLSQLRGVLPGLVREATTACELPASEPTWPPAVDSNEDVCGFSAIPAPDGRPD